MHSKILVVDVHTKTPTYTGDFAKYAEVIVSYDLSGVARDLFRVMACDYQINYPVLIDRRYTSTDDCNNLLWACDITEFVKRLETAKNNRLNNRRVPPLISLLKGFDVSEWDNLQVIHFEYN